MRRIATAESNNNRRFLDRARELDSRLHDLVATSCGNVFLANELDRLKTLFRAFRDVSYEHNEARNDHWRLAEEAKEHLAVVEALLKVDRKESVRAMAKHIWSGVKYWSRALPDDRGNQPFGTGRRTRSKAIRPEQTTPTAGT